MQRCCLMRFALLPKRFFTKQDLMEAVRKTPVFPEIAAMHPMVLEVLRYIQTILYENVLEEILKIQSNISKSYQDENRFFAVWNGELTQGCKDCCLKQKWTQTRSSVKCSLNCDFCYYYGLPQEYMAENTYGVKGMTLTIITNQGTTPDSLIQCTGCPLFTPGADTPDARD